MITDATLTRSLRLLQLEAGEQAKVIALLQKMEAELSLKLLSHNLTDFGKARTNALLSEAKAIIADYYSRVQSEINTTLFGLAPAEAQHMADILKEAIVSPVIAAKVTIDIGASIPTDNFLKSMVGNSMIQGSPLSSWWSKQAGDVVFRFSAEVRQGLIAGESNAQIISRVKEVMDIARNNAAALVQTAIQTVANETRLATYKKNSDISKGVRFVSTLDSHTCIVCGERDGMEWDFEGNGLNNSLTFQVPPLHVNCRCTLVDVAKSYAEMGITGVPEIPKNGTRASSEGYVSESTTFSEYLNRKGKAFQDEVLGKGRAQMWRDGKITLGDLLNAKGRPLTLKQLRAAA